MDCFCMASKSGACRETAREGVILCACLNLWKRLSLKLPAEDGLSSPDPDSSR